MGGTNVRDVTFDNNTFITMGRPLNGATIRLTPSDEVNNGTGDISFIRNKFKGIGGIWVRMKGVLHFEDNEIMMSNINDIPEYPMIFEILNEANFKGNKITIDDTVSFTSKYFFIGKGIFDNNELLSHENAQVRLVDDRHDEQYQVEIGLNRFSSYFYYLGETSNLTVRDKTPIIQRGVTGRIVHGGYPRTTQGKNSKINDLTTGISSSTGKITTFVCTVAGTPGTWVRTEGV